MPNDDRIVGEAFIGELRKYREAYQALSPDNKKAFVEGISSAKALAKLLDNLDPNQTTYKQVQDLVKFYYATQEIPAAVDVLKGFLGGKLWQHVSPPLAGLRPINIDHVNQFLSQEDKSNVQLASKTFFLDDTRARRLGQALLSNTIKGNQDTVVAMLKRYPELLLYRGNVRDYSGREFKDVTAFELALWALDVRHMAPAILKCVTDNEEKKDDRKELVPELQQQYGNVMKEGGGVTYAIGCGLLKISEDPRTLLPGQSDEEGYAALNRRLNRHDGLIQFEDKLFYFHNLIYPKKLVGITDPEAVNALKGLINKEARKLEVDKLQIINNDEELKLIQENVPDSRHIFREKHYDFTPLRRALDVYVHSFDRGSTWTRNQRKAHWCTVVGLAQHYVPAHVAQHYCNPDESFEPHHNYSPPTFKEEVFRRVLEFDNDISSEKDRWWVGNAVADRISGSGSSLPASLGFDLGIMREGSWERGAYGNIASVAAAALVGAAIDLAALTALCKVRTDDALELKQLLDSLQRPEAGPEPARCGV